LRGAPFARLGELESSDTFPRFGADDLCDTSGAVKLRFLLVETLSLAAAVEVSKISISFDTFFSTGLRDINCKKARCASREARLLRFKNHETGQ
jgi:hypothetical protein